jgi:hypothetical protein
MSWFQRAARILSPPYHLLDFDRAGGRVCEPLSLGEKPQSNAGHRRNTARDSQSLDRMQVDPDSRGTAIGAKWYMREYRDVDWHWPSPAYVEVAATYEEPLLAALARFEAQYGEIVTDYLETLLRLANVPPWWILFGPVLPPTIGLLATPGDTPINRLSGYIEHYMWRRSL